MTDEPKPKPPRKRSQFGLRRTPRKYPPDPKKIAAWLKFLEQATK